MIPYPYNMVDMGGIDLAEANGTVVDGLYAKIVEAVNACGDVVLYNWKFAGIEIAPQHTLILLGNPITINGAVQVTEQDLVTVPGINPDPPEPPEPPVLIPLEVDENGIYNPSDYGADGFSQVSVDVEEVVTNVIEQWDFADGNIVGEINKIALYQYAATFQAQQGLVLSTSGYVRFPFRFADTIFEFTILESASPSSTSRFFMCIDAGSSISPTDGFARASNGSWGFYAGGSWFYTDLTDANLLSNSVVSFEVTDVGTMIVKKGGLEIARSPEGKFINDLQKYVIIGANSGALPALISSLKIIKKGE